MEVIQPWQINQRLKYPLDIKIKMTLERIKNFYEHYDGKVFVSFSGGKDSLVLLHLVRSLYPYVRAVFIDTGLEYPEIKDFVNTIENVDIVRPKKSFKQVVDEVGYPVVSKKVARQVHDIRNPTGKNDNVRNLYLTGYNRKGEFIRSFKLSNKWRFLIDAPFKVSEKCCDVLKKEPMRRYEKESGCRPIIGTMVTDSMQRRESYMQSGCNNFKKHKSTPLAFWTEENIWEYIKMNKLSYCSIYDTGIERTGCMFCMFGVHLEKSPNRFERMEISHPKIFNYCMDVIGCRQVLDYIFKRSS